jgi:primase-polymerase (primpol)-like protein
MNTGDRLKQSTGDREAMWPNALPVSLRQYDQWVCWTTQERGGKATKVPLDPTSVSGGYASTADPATWGSFDAALQRATAPDVDGIGFVFTTEDPFVGVDLDDCRDESGLSDEAVEIVTRLHSYTEISPSGTGLHVLVRGELPEGPRRKGAIEAYDDARYFTMTGERLAGTPREISERSGPLQRVHEQFLSDSSSGDETGVTTQPATDSATEMTGRVGLDFGAIERVSLDDVTLLEKAHDAENGEKFGRLWRGETSGYDSHSEADMALCCLLAFWTGRDPQRVDELFRRSGLLRAKWDDVHYADGSTYGEVTVERACRRVEDEYQADAT